MALGGCGGLFGDNPFAGEDEGGTDTDPSTIPEGDEGPGTVPPKSGCESWSDCGSCDFCNQDGVCEEDVGACCAVGGDPGWRCSPPLDDCDWEGCPDGYECTFDGCIPIDDPDTFTPTAACADAPSLQAQVVTVAESSVPPALLDVDGDGTLEVITFSAATVSAHALDGTLVASVDAGDFVVTELLGRDAGSLLATGSTAAGAYTVGRLDVIAPGELSLQLGVAADEAGAQPSVARDFTGDGRLDVARVVGEQLHLWDLDATPTLTVDAMLAAAVERVDAFDFDADGAPEWLGFGKQTVQLSLQGDMVGAADWYTLPGEYEGSGTVRRADGSQQLVIVTTGAQPIARAQVTRVDTSAGPPALLDPFGAELQFAWLQIADLDGNGTDEIVVGHAYDGARAYELSDPAAPCHWALPEIGPWGATAGDLTGDGIADLLVSDGTGYTLWTVDAS